MSIVGLRKTLDYETASKLVDKGDFILGGLEYPATKLVRSPLFQRLAGEIDATATHHTIRKSLPLVGILLNIAEIATCVTPVDKELHRFTSNR